MSWVYLLDIAVIVMLTRLAFRFKRSGYYDSMWIMLLMIFMVTAVAVMSGISSHAQ